MTDGTDAAASQGALRVGSEGQVRGSDIVAAVVPPAAQAAEEQGMTSVTFCQMGAQQPSSPGGSFDAATCAFLSSSFQTPMTEGRIGCMFRPLYGVAEKGGTEASSLS